MTDKSYRAFNELWLEMIRYRDSQYKIQNLCSEAANSFVEENYRDSAKNAFMSSLKPFLKKRETKIYEAAKAFIENYETNDLVE